MTTPKPSTGSPRLTPKEPALPVIVGTRSSRRTGYQLAKPERFSRRFGIASMLIIFGVAGVEGSNLANAAAVRAASVKAKTPSTKTASKAPAKTTAKIATKATEKAAANGAVPKTTNSPVVAAKPVITENTYSSATTKLSIKKVVTGTGDETLVYFVADVVVADSRVIRGGFADNKYGTNIVANTSTIALENNAMFAINGDYYGFRDSGMLIRNGVIYRDKGARTGLAMYQDGTMRVYDEKATTAGELLKAGVWNTLSFGPALVVDGTVPEGVDNIEIDTNFGNHSVQGSHPRTGLGMISPNHFVFIAVDGRSRGYSKGVTMSEFAELFKGLGATVAYNLDGGGSTTMWFNGKVVNNPLGRGRERGTSDIIYVGG
jgi:exopolysaccharide biosynthesis protein